MTDTPNTDVLAARAREGRARDMLLALVGPTFGDTALRVATDWLAQEGRLATPIPSDVREDIICVRDAVTDEQWEKLWVSLHGLKCNPVMDEITLVMQEVVAILCAPKVALATPQSDGTAIPAGGISKADALAVVDRCTPPAAGGPFSHTNSMRCIADDIRKGIDALATAPKVASDTIADQLPGQWDHRYRPLKHGEVIEATDECRRDDGSWVSGTCVGELAPDPAYTSHRVYRRLIPVASDTMLQNSWINTPEADREQAMLLAEVELHLKQCRVFITSREKMHPCGVDLHDELLCKVTTALDGIGREKADG